MRFHPQMTNLFLLGGLFFKTGYVLENRIRLFVFLKAVLYKHKNNAKEFILLPVHERHDSRIYYYNLKRPYIKESCFNKQRISPFSNTAPFSVSFIFHQTFYGRKFNYFFATSPTFASTPKNETQFMAII